MKLGLISFFIDFHRIGTPRVVLDAPLLVESGLQSICHKIIVIKLPKEAQLQRLMLRNEFTMQEALSRIESQMPTDKKLKVATHVIDNAGTLEQLEQQVDTISSELSKATSWFNRLTLLAIVSLPIVAYVALR